MKVSSFVLCCLALAGLLFAEDGGGWTDVIRGGGGHLDQQWGPDAFGYRAKNQQESGGPTAVWTDISSYGIQVAGLADDNAVGPFTVGFTFHYYWYDVNQFWVGSNGYIKFSSRGQISGTYAQYPNTTLPNDVVGIYTADWVMSGTNPTDSACYYWTNNVDTLIVMWKNVRAYSSGGSHNFEIILCGGDSSITFQYGTQSGTVSTDAVGIENFTGKVGLNTFYNANVNSNSAIRFYYPDTLNYTTSDLAVVAVQNPLSNGFFVVRDDSVQPWVQLANLGTTAQSACSLRYVIRRPSGTVVLQLDTVIAPQLNSLDTLTVQWPMHWAAADTGTFLATATVTLGGTDVDSVSYNNTMYTEFHVLTLPGELAYDDGGSERPSSWTVGGRAVAMEFVPPRYPMLITQTKVYIATGGTAYDVSILANDGVDGEPGTELWRHHFASSTTGWNSIAVPADSGRIDHGSFYVAYWLPSGTQWGVDSTSAQGFSHRAWEFVNVWSQSKFWNIGDPMIRASIRPIVPPPSPFTRLSPTDGSTVPWMQGLIQFRWSQAVDPGTTVTYHLSVTSGDYHRNWTTTDTTYSDSLSWFYGGTPRADVTWSVWGTNGQDTVYATNGQGMFHLNANHPPQAFTRLTPAENANFFTFQAPFTMNWTRAGDTDGDPVNYVLSVMGRDSSLHRDTTMQFSVQDTFYTGDLRPLWPRGLPMITRITWSVRASDGWDTTSASNNPGHFTLHTESATDDKPDFLPHEFALNAYPVPFNSTTVLRYEVPVAANVELKIFNLAGQEVAVLYQGHQTPGRYRAEWNATQQASGTYFAILKAGNTTKMQKLLLLK